MIAVVLENDSHSRETLSRMLHDMGYAQIYYANHIDEADFFFSREQNKINLVVTSDLTNPAQDLPVSRFLLRSAEHDLCPLLVTSDDLGSRFSSRIENRFSRIDTLISKPFCKNGFYRAVIRAHERRARMRSTLVIYGDGVLPELEESIFSVSDGCHWKLVQRVKTQNELTDFFKNPNFRTGALVLQANAIRQEQIKSIRRFKRTPLGVATPLAILGGTSEMLHELRLIGNLFFTESTKPKELITTLSNRLRHQWQIRHELKMMRNAYKNKQFKVAISRLRNALKVDSTRWEVLETAGVILGNPNFLRQALETQPFHPAIHLQLHRLSPFLEKIKIAKNAKLYCPRHPEIQELPS